MDAVPDYEVRDAESLKWALTVDWANVNDLVRNNLDQYPPGDHGAAIESGKAADLDGLFSLYREPIYATAAQVTAGGPHHRDAGPGHPVGAGPVLPRRRR